MRSNVDVSVFTGTDVCIYPYKNLAYHYSDVIVGMMMSKKNTSLAIVYLTVYSGADQRKHQSSASLALVWGIHQWLVNSPHKWPLTRKMLPFDGVIMVICNTCTTIGRQYHLYRFIGRHWSRQWLGVIKQQATSWVRGDTIVEMQHHWATLG